MPGSSIAPYARTGIADGTQLMAIAGYRPKYSRARRV